MPGVGIGSACVLSLHIVLRAKMGSLVPRSCFFPFDVHIPNAINSVSRYGTSHLG